MCLKRKCCYCGYPKSEKYRFVNVGNGRKRKEYCCNICYKLRVMNGENNDCC